MPSKRTWRRFPLVMALAALAVSCGVPGRELFLPRMPLHRADAIVVLGNRPAITASGEVAPETARRVRRGVELYREGLAPRFVVTGGRDPNGAVEADVMARYAEEQGVPAEAIVRERRSQDTAENAGYSVAALCRGRPDCHPRVIVVSSPYHLRRAVLLFRCAGARSQHAATAVPDDFGYELKFALYEYGARLSYVFDDACARARRGAQAR